MERINLYAINSMAIILPTSNKTRNNKAIYSIEPLRFVNFLIAFNGFRLPCATNQIALHFAQVKSFASIVNFPSSHCTKQSQGGELCTGFALNDYNEMLLFE